MKKYLKLLIGVAMVAIVFVYIKNVIDTHGLAVLDAKGSIAQEQRELLTFTAILSLFVVIPVFALIIFISVRYRETNRTAKYTPNWDHSKIAETVWWGIPLILITILAVVTWRSSHDLDPFRPIVNGNKPVEIQVVALQWKWLFIYPEDRVATINSLYVPVDRPLNFTLTADAPMNSFWIPQLGGQIYAMPGMSTKLHLLAHEEGIYRGSSSNISGEGFSDMDFNVNAISQEAYSNWVAKMRSSNQVLDYELYESLRNPTIDDQETFFQLKDISVYDNVVESYMHKAHNDRSNYE